MIPFNQPHGLKVIQLDPEATIVQIPYKKKNLNHLKGLHACVLATAAEYCSGLVLFQYLDPKKYRLIMESIDVQYHYQAKMEATAKFGLQKEEVESSLIQVLASGDPAFFVCQIEVHDIAENHICTVRSNWQMKSWKQVRTQ